MRKLRWANPREGAAGAAATSLIHRATPSFILALLAVWTAVLALPSGAAMSFNGLPFSSVPEAIALFAALPLLTGSAVRRLAARALRSSPVWLTAAMYAAAAALALKVLLVWAPITGFAGCYQSTLAAPPLGTCERSFENPFNRFSATRLDATVDFGPADWNLTFFNSLRFNFYPWVSGVRRRDRLPFSAVWQGSFDARGDPLTVVYVGEGSLLIDDTLVTLPRAYDAERTLTVSVSAGRHQLRLRYTFDDESVTGSARRFGPYATLRLTEEGNPSRPLAAARGPAWVRVAGFLADGLTIGSLVWLLTWYAWVLRGALRAAAAVTVAGAAAFLARNRLLTPGVDASVISCAILSALIWRNRSTTLLFGYFALFAVGWVTLGPIHRDVHAVVYRTAGNDWLTYESHARTVLESGLWGDEYVYYNQPLFRYVRFAEHAVLGDGDMLIDLAGWVALHFTILWAASIFLMPVLVRPARLLVVIAAALTLCLADWPPVVNALTASLSESATWILLAAGVAALGANRSARWPLGAAFLAMALITRPNQAPGLILVLVALLLPRAKVQPQRIASALIVFIAISALPLAHNLFYGHRFVVFTTTANNPAALGVTIPTLLKTAADADARHQLASQLRGLLFLPPNIRSQIDAGNSPLVLHGLQVAWIGGICLMWSRRTVRSMRVLVLAPALFLAVHIVYDITSYYPRHVLAGYFAMGIVTMACASGATTRQRGEPITIASTQAPGR